MLAVCSPVFLFFFFPRGPHNPEDRHPLKAKIGAVLMILRNLSPRDGMCNGTRFLLTHVRGRVLQGVIISGEFLGKKVMIPRIPLNRMGTPEDVARTIYYLCSEDAGYVTGSELWVTGGQHLF